MKVYVIVIKVPYEGETIYKVVDSLAKAVELVTYHDPEWGEYAYYEMGVE